MVAGAAVSLLSPVELIKIHSQMVTEGQRGPLAVIRELRARGGIFSKNGVFRGFTTQLARDPYGYRNSLLHKTFELKVINNFRNQKVSKLFKAYTSSLIHWY